MSAHAAARRQRPNFDRVARLYQWAEYLLLGRRLERTRNFLLRQVSTARCALVLGDGDGRFIHALLRQNPHTRVLAVDLSRTMLTLLQRRCRFAGPRLRTHQLAASSLADSGLDLSEVDLIVTHFFLDCLESTDVEQLAVTLASRVAPGAVWLVSDFAYPARLPWRLLGRLYIRGLYAAFRLLTGLRQTHLPAIAPALSQAGFVGLCRHECMKGLLFTELWKLAPGTASAHSAGPAAQLDPACCHPPLL